MWSPAPALGDTVLLDIDAQPGWQDELIAADLAQLDAIEAAYKVRLHQVSHNSHVALLAWCCQLIHYYSRLCTQHQRAELKHTHTHIAFIFDMDVTRHCPDG